MNPRFSRGAGILRAADGTLEGRSPVFLRMKQAKPPPTRWPLDAPLFPISAENRLSARELMEDVIAFGGKGSGKTSCMAHLLKTLLERQWGALILTAKTEEVQHALKLCRAAGRMNDVRLIGPGHLRRINALKYELDASGHIENLVQLLMRFLELSERRGGTPGGENSFFRRSAQQLARHILTLVIAATGDVNLPVLQNIIGSAPTARWLTWPEAELNEEQQRQARQWREQSACMLAIRMGDARLAEMSPAEAEDFAYARRYILEQWPELAIETRTGVSATFTSIVDLFSRSPLRELFCQETNLRPESIWEDGLILIQDAPIHLHGETGLYQQAAWKFLFQKAAMRRDPQACDRPVVLWEDEYQETVSPALDQQFACVSRSTRTACCRMTQNISNLHAVSHNRAEVDSLIGNHANRLFFKCDDVATMNYGQELGGRVLRRFISTTVPPAPFDPMDFWWGAPSTCSTTTSEHYEYVLPAAEFASLRRGGPHGFAECIAFLSSGDDSEGRPRWVRSALPQWFG